MFSATYPDWVKQIERKFISKDRIFIDMFKKSENQTNLNVKHLAIQCDFKDRITSLGNVVMTYAGKPSSRTIVFCNTKQDCGEIQMNSNLDVELAVLNGDVSQPQREQTMRLFRDGKIQVLVATNVAARGLDIPEVELIIQLEPPTNVDDYIHRAGRTARAGKSGTCVTFYDKKNKYLLS